MKPEAPEIKTLLYLAGLGTAGQYSHEAMADKLGKMLERPMNTKGIFQRVFPFIVKK